MSKKILIVDDSGLARRTMQRLLQGQDYTVEEASDGAQALERYFINRHDVILLDIVMHGMYGLEVLGKLRELDPNVRVVIASADIQKSTREEARQGGAAGFINKPIDQAELIKVLSTVLTGGFAWT